ncbi:MAG TPA: hypothetical protein VIK18_05180 [Pirellulales bacterium]
MMDSNAACRRIWPDFALPGRGLKVRGATTLIELLVVVTIMLLITGIAIRTVMPAIEGRQIREGARQLNVFINSARNRAMVTGRPMGVWIDRLAGLPEAAVAVSYAQVPEPYSGDYADSGVEGFVAYDSSSKSTYGYLRAVNVIRAGSMNAGNYDMWCANGGGYTGIGTSPAQRFIRPGDTIQLNYRNQPYRLAVDSSGALMDMLGVPLSGKVWIIAQGLAKNNFQDPKYLNQPWLNTNGGSWYYPLNYFDDQGDRVQPVITSGSSVNGHGKPVPYQIFRQPIRSAAGSMQLPDTVVIDLNFSGDDQKNYYPRLGPPSTLSNVSYPTNAPDPYQGSPAYLQLGLITDTTPIIIMFSPGGAVEQVYTRYLQAPTTTAGGQWQWIWRGDRQLSTINFLVGSRDNVPVVDTTSNWATQLNYNWTQPTNIWVAIQPRTGLVTSAEVVPPAVLYAGAYGSVAWQNLNQSAVIKSLVLTYLQGYAESTTNARGYSSHGNQMSGQ